MSQASGYDKPINQVDQAFHRVKVVAVISGSFGSTFHFTQGSMLLHDGSSDVDSGHQNLGCEFAT